jgi:hypothetical protein
MKTMNFRLYGLLHLAEGNHSAENVLVNDFNYRLSVYLNCAITLFNCLRSKDIEFILLTNSKYELERIKPAGVTLPIEEIPFCTDVPRGIKFFSAHFKLDAFRYFSQLPEGYVGLCDLDMVCLNDFPRCLHNIIKQKIPLCYDISDQVIPAYGHEVIIRDLQSIHHVESEGRWYGGEFISGPPDFFLTLTKEIDLIYENYIKNLENLHTMGDEPTTSAALELIRKRGTYVADAGALGIVGRFWNAVVLHPQRPFEYFQQCFLLHLPADKRFLAGLSQETTVTLCGFVKKYQAHRLRPQPKKGIRDIVKDVVKTFMPKKVIQWLRNRRASRVVA